MSTVCKVCRRRGASREANLCGDCQATEDFKKRVEGDIEISNARAASPLKASKSKKGKG